MAYQKVIVGIDLKAEGVAPYRKLLDSIRQIAKGAKIEPVCVLNREDKALADGLRSRIGSLKQAVERNLDKQLAKEGIPGLVAGTVVFADGSSTNAAVKALLKHAKKVGADLIGVRSHSKTGLERAMLGSFAETLTLYSDIPLLVLNPQSPQIKSPRSTILFPTDFSDGSKQGLLTLCRSLKGTKNKVLLFHGFVYPAQIYINSYIGYPLPQSAFEAEFKDKVKLGQQWKNEVKDLGVDCDFTIDRKSPFVVDGIITAAKQHNVGAVAMVSNTGRIGVTLLGSVTRQVLRNALWPVWVVHPPKRSTKKPVLKISRSSAVQRLEANGRKYSARQ